MKHKNIMIVGTSSGAGKSMTVTGLCRIFFKDGKSVAPFKSQNMSLNSFITKKGDEIGRAQELQAVACELEPEFYMNPILLKPSGNGKIQVILNGKSIGNMGGTEYSEKKEELKKEIFSAYENVKKFDIGVIEGAGSPVELNLMKNDIVNMGLAEMLDAPVILVADIDRGGVFASIYGTIMLMNEKERARVKGVIINKFRGYVEMLESGLREIERLTNVPVLGVIPYFKLNLEDEDGVSEKFKSVVKTEKGINIGVVKLKHLSNFTDLDVFLTYDDVNIKYLERAEDFSNEDLIIIPGSKNTIKDIEFLRESGMDKKILEAKENGKFIFGICGGFQILGKKVMDPYGVEGERKEIEGLGLLNLETVMEKKKFTQQYKGKIRTQSFGDVEEFEIEGYEIHQGETLGEEKNISIDDRVVAVEKENIFATYVHGIFDNRKFTDKILNKIRNKKGIEEKFSNINYKDYRLQELDKLEKIYRENLDMKKVYEILEGK